MTMLRLLIAALLVLAAAAALAQPAAAPAPAAPAGPPMVEVIPPTCDDILHNPRMGLYGLPPQDLNDDEWLAKLVNVYYIRMHWSDLNPEEGVYNFDSYFGPILEFCRQHHMRLALRVMSESMHGNTQYVTPKWVFDKGVPGVQHTGLYDKAKVQIDPVFWDDRYLDLNCAFVKKLGEYFADKPNIEYVDLGGIGEWGEMHLMRWTSQQLEETGFTEAKYALAYRRMIDAYRDAFPHTQLFLNIGGQDHLSINDYAAIKGVNFRQDGLLPSGGSYDCGEWLYKPYSRRGVVCNYEFCLGYDEMVQKNLDVLATIKKGLEAPISYMHINLFWGGAVRKAPQEVKDALTDAARRIGYRFVIASVKHMEQVKLVPGRAARVPLEVTWRNDGIAPCYDSFMTRWYLVDAAGKTVAQEDLFPKIPTTQWWPGESNTQAFLLRVPAGAAPGTYTLKVAMLLPEKNQNILLGIQGHEADGGYALCPISAVAGEAAASNLIYESGFETETAPWGVTDGVTAALVGDDAHSGTKSLLVSGTTATAWNYASFRVPKPLTGFGKYHFSAWMKVEECSSNKLAPYLKVGINSAAKWITNFSTQKYDLSKLGTWQLLEGTADLPADAATADFAIEKGDNGTPVTVKLRLDDVKLELVEAP